jgi:Family of unknown function (DUF6879)
MLPLDQDHFMVMFAKSRTAFRLEHQREPLPGEEAAVQHWSRGNSTVPWEWPQWRSWLDLAWRHVSNGGEIRRVRLVDEPPTSYQRWAIQCTPWHDQAGDQIRYLSRGSAAQLGIIVANWWLFDDTRVVLLNYDGGDVPSKILVTDPAEIRRYQSWRDLALRHAMAAEAVTV